MPELFAIFNFQLFRVLTVNLSVYQLGLHTNLQSDFKTILRCWSWLQCSSRTGYQVIIALMCNCKYSLSRALFAYLTALLYVTLVWRQMQRSILLRINVKLTCLQLEWCVRNKIATGNFVETKPVIVVVIYFLYDNASVFENCCICS